MSDKAAETSTVESNEVQRWTAKRKAAAVLDIIKGKTTAALGQALRAAGQGLRVCFIQFIKARSTGEHKALEKLADCIELHVTGSGFTWEEKNRQKVVETARQGWQLAAEKILSDQYDMVILDELTYLITYSIVTETEVLELLAKRPQRLHVVITGRNASPGLIEAADTVTEMRMIRHHFEAGVPARKGVEF